MWAVCSFCASTLVRHDLNLETLGKMAELPEDMSPLQLGARGVLDKVRFEIRGRLRMGWEDGSWNEWYAVFEDGREGWLAEAQGQFMMSFAVADVSGVPPGRELAVGSAVRLGGTAYVVRDIKQATCVGSQGELPFRAPQGRKSVSVDLGGEGGKFACLEYSLDDGIRAFTGRYVELEALKPEGLRELDGW